ncbi:MAG: DUF3881 family protein [Epulopiscium sp.]|nr:DUF3881 family protein [Candidatus Epulonipiscium sp.]HOQ15867.1 DUF3881 family protein [Defluviitaleaceae bacterium]HPT76319.1 DUF3881 family protein [Defluviitaleaceae bacterium]
METYMSAVGFGSIKKKKQWDKLIEEVLNHADKRYVTNHDEDHVFIEYYKSYGKNIGVVLRGLLDNEKDIDFETCDPYFESKYIMEVSEVEVEEDEEDYFYFAATEEEESGVEIVFQLQNIIEYLEIKDDKHASIEGIKVVGLASKGTIILPVEKSENDLEYENEQKEWRKELLKRIKAGDEEARKILETEAEEAAEIIEERLRHEDILSVIEGYFIPVDYLEATYSILGEIKEIELIINEETREEIYWMLVESMGMSIEIAINANELVGTPLVGMRFMGICWMQGTIVFS